MREWRLCLLTSCVLLSLGDPLSSCPLSTTTALPAMAGDQELRPALFAEVIRETPPPPLEQKVLQGTLCTGSGPLSVPRLVGGLELVVSAVCVSVSPSQNVGVEPDAWRGGGVSLRPDVPPPRAGTVGTGEGGSSRPRARLRLSRGHTGPPGGACTANVRWRVMARTLPQETVARGPLGFLSDPSSWSSGGR